MARGEIVHVVLAVAFEHVGLQQRVVCDAGQRDAVVGEDVLVVFQVLSDLGVLHRLQPGLKPRQRLLAIELRHEDWRCAVATLDGYLPAVVSANLKNGVSSPVELTLQPMSQTVRLFTDLPDGKVVLDDQPPRACQEFAPPAWSYREEAKHFVACVRSGEAFRSTHRHSAMAPSRSPSSTVRA